jgi:hypothetical protein
MPLHDDIQNHINELQDFPTRGNDESIFTRSIF